MKALKLTPKTLVALSIMIGLMVITRSHSAFAGIHLADFTLPALIIAGVYFKQWLVPVILIIAAVAIDNFAIVYQGVSANCITPAYSLLPLLYLAVYWVAKRIDSLAIKNVSQLPSLAVLIVGLIVAQWLLATTSYYAFTTAKWADFASYAMQWAPVEILPVVMWMAVIVGAFTINAQLSLITYFTPAKR